MQGEASRALAGRESAALRAALERFPTRRAWLGSPDGIAIEQRLSALLGPVQQQHGGMPAGSAGTTLHIAHWNILHGIEFDAVAAALAAEPRLAAADLVSLNEADAGLARSGNRHVAFDLARARGLHAAWAAQFLELAGGYRTPPEIARAPHGESLFGLALLSRWPLAGVRRIELPSPVDLLFERERKAGCFVALVAEVQHPVRPFTVAVAHLDVHGSPHGRAAQMRTVLGEVPAGPAVVMGDFNTTTFARGSALRSVRTLATLALAPRGVLRGRLLAPWAPAGRAREPLFDELRRAGFEVASFNDGTESLHVHFADVHELDRFPAWLRRAALGALRPVERRNGMRLDWIAVRGFRAGPLPPFTLAHLLGRRPPPSDHAPVGCSLQI